MTDSRLLSFHELQFLAELVQLAYPTLPPCKFCFVGIILQSGDLYERLKQRVFIHILLMLKLYDTREATGYAKNAGDSVPRNLLHRC